MKYFLIVFSLVVVSFTSFSEEESGKLLIHIKGIEGRNGVLLIDLFDRKDGFPSNRSIAVFSIDSDITGDEAIIELPSLPYGSYSLSIVHDENSNNKLDTNIFKIPKEGWSASSYPKKPMAAPDFKKSNFVFNADSQIVELVMFY